MSTAPLVHRYKYWIIASVLAHVIVMTATHFIMLKPPVRKMEAVKVKVVELKKEMLAEAVPTPTKPTPPKPKQLPPPAKPEQRKAKSPASPQAAKVQGLTKDSVSSAGSIAAPVGNTLMIEDKGKRLTPDEIANLKQDLSSPPLLVALSYNKPQYTDAALTVNLEGKFKIDVFVNESGVVQSAELPKKIGFGMDERILVATRSAKFIPAKNEKGIPYAAWGQFTITLEIE